MTTLLYFFFFGADETGIRCFLRIPPEARTLQMPEERKTVRVLPDGKTIAIPATA